MSMSKQASQSRLDELDMKYQRDVARDTLMTEFQLHEITENTLRNERNTLKKERKKTRALLEIIRNEYSSFDTANDHVENPDLDVVLRDRFKIKADANPSKHTIRRLQKKIVQLQTELEDTLRESREPLMTYMCEGGDNCLLKETTALGTLKQESLPAPPRTFMQASTNGAIERLYSLR